MGFVFDCFNTQPPEGGCACSLWLNSRYSLFQHTAARRRLRHPTPTPPKAATFQHTAARRRLRHGYFLLLVGGKFQHTAARRRLHRHRLHRRLRMRFNTQPPEGGCQANPSRPCPTQRFNTQPPEGGCHRQHDFAHRIGAVSTHSRPKAAASYLICKREFIMVSTHSRPKAAAPKQICVCLLVMFQHTAARRRLHRFDPNTGDILCFNTQPPEGGCSPALSQHPQRLSRLCFAKLRGKAVGRV